MPWRDQDTEILDGMDFNEPQNMLPAIFGTFSGRRDHAHYTIIGSVSLVRLQLFSAKCLLSRLLLNQTTRFHTRTQEV